MRHQIAAQIFIARRQPGHKAIGQRKGAAIAHAPHHRRLRLGGGHIKGQRVAPVLPKRQQTQRQMAALLRLAQQALQAQMRLWRIGPAKTLAHGPHLRRMQGLKFNEAGRKNHAEFFFQPFKIRPRGQAPVG